MTDQPFAKPEAPRRAMRKGGPTELKPLAGALAFAGGLAIVIAVVSALPIDGQPTSPFLAVAMAVGAAALLSAALTTFVASVIDRRLVEIRDAIKPPS